MKKRYFTGSALTGLLIITSPIVSPSIAHAEADSPGQSEKTPEDYTLEEITVTANRRSERMQDVPTSVASISAQALKDVGATSTLDIANLVPGVQMVQENTGSDNYFSIRGITQNDYAEHEESPVAVYMDGVYLSQAAATGGLLFDTERVEVLRGPQGTLFGRNATAGAVQFFSKLPTEEKSGYLQTSFGNYRANHTEGAYGQGVGDDWAFRISFANDHQDQFSNNVLYPGGAINGHAARLQLRYEPNNSLSATTNVHISSSKTSGGVDKWINTYPDSNNHMLGTPVPDNVDVWSGNYGGGTLVSCPGCNILGYKVPASMDYYSGAANLQNTGDARMWGLTETIKYQIGTANLTSITDYSKYKKNYFDDSDGTPQDIFNYWTHVNTNQFSQEIHIDNGSSGPLRWIAGVYYLSMNGRYIEGVGYGTDYSTRLGYFYGQDTPFWLSPPDNQAAEQHYTIKTHSWSEFAQLDFDILPRLTATVGARWSSERKKLDYTLIGLSCDVEGCPLDPTAPTFDVNTATAGDNARVNENDWSGKVALSWKVTDDIIPYISYNKGLKAGGFNAPLAQLTDPDGNTTYYAYKFGEEKLYSLEIGSKNEFFNHKLRINGDVFFYHYVGYQAFNQQGAVTYITNNPSSIRGGELEIAVAPYHGVDLALGMAFLHTRIDGIFLPDGSVASRQAANAPKFTLNGSASYKWSLVGGEASIGTDFNYRSSQFYQLLNGPASQQKGYWLVNAHTNYTFPDKHWSVQLYGKNLSGLRYITNAVISDGQGFGQGVFGAPRTFGIQFGYAL